MNKQSLAENHPVQPLITDEQGVIRFKRNKIVEFLAEGRLNELACMGFPAEDYEQLAQLIGYSLDGFGTLSYATDETYERAAAQQAQPVQQPAFFTRTIYMRTTVHGTTCLDSLDGIAEEQKHLWKEVFTTPLVDAQQAQPVQQIVVQAIKNAPEFNMNGYDDDDVRRLHDWAVSMVNLVDAQQERDSAKAEAVLAAVSALYFSDNSGYDTALYSVIHHLAPDLMGDMENNPKRAFEKAQAALAQEERNG